MAEGAGIKRTLLVTEAADVPALRKAVYANEGPFFGVVKIDPASLPLVLPPREGAVLQARMREHLMGPAAHLA